MTPCHCWHKLQVRLDIGLACVSAAFAALQQVAGSKYRYRYQISILKRRGMINVRWRETETTKVRRHPILPVILTGTGHLFRHRETAAIDVRRAERERERESGGRAVAMAFTLQKQHQTKPKRPRASSIPRRQCEAIPPPALSLSSI